MNDYYTVFSRVFCWKGDDEVGVAEAIARTVVAREDLWPRENEDAQDLLERIEELGPCPREDPDGDWLTEADHVAERAFAFVGLEVEEDDDAGWGDGLWLRDHHMLSRQQLEQLRAALAAVAPSSWAISSSGRRRAWGISPVRWSSGRSTSSPIPRCGTTRAARRATRPPVGALPSAARRLTADPRPGPERRRELAAWRG